MTTKKKPEVGDVVCLRNGGPPMVVEEIVHHAAVLKAQCLWHDDDGRIQRYAFLLDLLIDEEERYRLREESRRRFDGPLRTDGPRIP